MDYKIIVDSCCDMTLQLAKRLGVISIPLTMRLGEKEYTDDDNLDINGFMADMDACREKVSTSAPSPILFKEAIESATRSFIVTISNRLSATHESAVSGKAMAEEEAKVDTHVFDSKSASAGEVLIAVKIREFLSKGMPKEQIIKSINSFIDGMKTLFVLERYDNLIKNGRLGKVSGKIINVLNIKLIMGADGDGSIMLFSKPRGTKQMIEKMMSYIREKGASTSGETMVITHNNNIDLVTRLCDSIKKQFDFKEIIIVPTRGAISVYADNKGVVMAF